LFSGAPRRNGAVPQADRPLRRSNCQPAFSGSGCKAAPEGSDGSVCLLGGQEDAAVRQLEVRLGPQEGKARGSVLGQMLRADVQLIEGRDGVVEMAGPGSSDEHLGDREGAGYEQLACEVAQKRRSRPMVSVPGIQVGDEHAGVEHDHVGQSSRSASR
jgi:hypothetical protein